VIGVCPLSCGGVYPVVVYAGDDFLPVNFEFFGAAGEVLVDSWLGKGVGNCNHAGGVLAWWVAGFIVLGLDIDAIVPDGDDGLFPGRGQAGRGDCDCRDAADSIGGCHCSWSVKDYKPISSGVMLYLFCSCGGMVRSSFLASSA